MMVEERKEVEVEPRKTHVNLSIDQTLYNAVRAKTDNVSALVEDLLRAWLVRQDQVYRKELELREKIRAMEEELRILRNQISREAVMAVLLKKLEPWIEAYKKMEARGWDKYPGGKQKFLEDSAARLGLTPGEVEAYCKGARKVG